MFNYILALVNLIIIVERNLESIHDVKDMSEYRDSDSIFDQSERHRYDLPLTIPCIGNFWKKNLTTPCISLLCLPINISKSNMYVLKEVTKNVSTKKLLT